MLEGTNLERWSPSHLTSKLVFEGLDEPQLRKTRSVALYGCAVVVVVEIKRISKKNSKLKLNMMLEYLID
ncbi:hypothetical protein HanIR_Chr15g0774751 [Helianthus annuus]|nr:hypothetical protein HanIR_Chr15g0774751 [Helianthus annuus]